MNDGKSVRQVNLTRLNFISYDKNIFFLLFKESLMAIKSAEIFTGLWIPLLFCNGAAEKDFIFNSCPASLCVGTKNVGMHIIDTYKVIPVM